MLMLWITGLAAPATICLAALLALVLDALFGEPDWLYRRAPHPVAWLGARIEAGEAIWNRDDHSEASRFRRGLALTLAVTLGALAVGLSLGLIFWAVPMGWLLEAALAAMRRAGRDLDDQVAAGARNRARSRPEGLAPALVLRFGDMPTSKALRTWLAETGVDQIVIDADPAWSGT